MTYSLQRMCVSFGQRLYTFYVGNLNVCALGVSGTYPDAQENFTGVVWQAVLFLLSRSAGRLAPLSSSNVTKIHPAMKAPASKGFCPWESGKFNCQAEL